MTFLVFFISEEVAVETPEAEVEDAAPEGTFYCAP